MTPTIPASALQDVSLFDARPEPGYTYKLDLKSKRVVGMVDGRTSVTQAIYKILYTERYAWLIYNWDYGMELEQYLGQEFDYVTADIERSITEALMVNTAGSTVLYASGNGEVAATGTDSVVGNVVAVKYTQVVNHVTGKVQDVIFRYFHLASIAVKKGDKVTKDTRLGNYGNTGSLQGMAIHLHLEVDTDTSNPLYSPTVKSSSLLKGSALGANDKTMTNPLEWLFCKTDALDNQTYTTTNDAYIRAEDKAVPQVSDTLTGKGIIIEGIDVSNHNGAVDWAAVKASGKDFAFVRVGWTGWDGGIVSNGGLDKRFHDNMRGALAAGLNVGAYVYSYCKTPEAAQIAARETLELVKPYNLTYPIAFDIEDITDAGTRYDQMSKAYNNAIVNAFLSIIQDAGFYGMLYTYKSFAESYLDMTSLSWWDMWIAQYANECTYKGEYGIWQYKGDATGFVGSCPGVTGACDLNVAYKDYAEVIAESGLNGFPKLTEAEESVPADVSGLDSLQKKNEKLKRDIVDLKTKISALEDKLRQINQLSA